jgi:hypothetical protein
MNTFVMDPLSLLNTKVLGFHYHFGGGGSNTKVLSQYKSIEVEYKSIEFNTKVLQANLDRIFLFQLVATLFGVSKQADRQCSTCTGC